jgi:nucleotide-binding universal stress UspA family protein
MTGDARHSLRGDQLASARTAYLSEGLNKCPNLRTNACIDACPDPYICSKSCKIAWSQTCLEKGNIDGCVREFGQDPPSARTFMKTNSLRKWSRPKVILVVTTLTESPAHIFRVVSGLKRTGVRLFLVQLPVRAHKMCSPNSSFPSLLSAAPRSFDRHAGNGAFLWAEILSEVTVLKNIPIDRIPVFAESLGADWVVLTAPETGRIQFRSNSTRSGDLFESLPIPVMICGPQMRQTRSWDGRELRKILVPITFGPDLPLQIRFACRFAKRHHGRLTVFHTFESPLASSRYWERTPLVVEQRLPISELKNEGIMCPMEIAIAEGYPDRQILSFNERKPHDLILMGGPRRRHPLQTIAHSVAEQVIAGSQCPVFLLGSALASASSDLTRPDSELSLA